MAWTRLLNMDLGALEEHTIDALPPYIAASHAWSDYMFAPGVAFNDTRGGKVINAAVRPILTDIVYCWVDTLCIDQNDEQDKERQIPLMGDIYSKAFAVVILTTTEYNMTQAFLDNMAKDLGEAVYIALEETYTDDVTSYWQNGKGRQKIIEAMEVLEIFTRTTWATRIWTLQEYILAGKIVWVGADNIPLQIDDTLFMAIPDLCDVLNINEAIGGKYAKLYAFFQGMANFHLKKNERTRVMELLGNRTASYPDDEIYGAMAASGVIIQPGIVHGQENVWRMWWEEAITQGHHRWMFLPPVTDRRTGTISVSGNCLMPNFHTRGKASQNSGLDTVQVKSGVILLKDGGVKLVGRWAGSCRIVRRLGLVYETPENRLHRDLTLILSANGSWQLAMRIAAAFGGGRYSWKQILAIAQILKANYVVATTAVQKGTEENFRLRRFTRYQSIVWKDFMHLVMSQMIPMNDGVAYLAQITNEIRSTDIIVISDDGQPKDELHALDFGVQDSSQRNVFIIVTTKGTDQHSTVTASDSPIEQRLHKIGTSVPMIVTKNVHKARAYKCHTVSPELMKFILGGQKCGICQALAETASTSPSSTPRTLDAVL